jgi:hypothetical protein
MSRLVFVDMPVYMIQPISDKRCDSFASSALREMSKGKKSLFSAFEKLWPSVSIAPMTRSELRKVRLDSTFR